MHCIINILSVLNFLKNPKLFPENVQKVGLVEAFYFYYFNLFYDFI